MIHLVMLTSVLGLAGQAQSALPAPTSASARFHCGDASASVADAAVGQLCAGEEALRRAEAAAKGSQERAAQLRVAAATLRRAASLSSKTETTVWSLHHLATTYDVDQLNQPGDLEQVLREWIAVTPDDLAPMYRLAKVQEDRLLIDASEATLLDARHRQPDAEEPNRMLAQFYARRVTALHTRNLQTPPETVSSPGERDASGVYRIGGSLAPPARSDVPQYPPEAAAAGIKGSVLAEIVIDGDGSVADARVVRSVPLLDEAALKAVRNWRFTPTVVNGQAVPVRMTVTVNFTTSR